MLPDFYMHVFVLRAVMATGISASDAMMSLEAQGFSIIWLQEALPYVEHGLDARTSVAAHNAVLSEDQFDDAVATTPWLVTNFIGMQFRPLN